MLKTPNQFRLNKVFAFCAALIALVLIAPFFINSRYVFHVGIMALMNLLLVTGLFIMTGLTGQMNLAQAAFWALGAYSYSIMVTSGHSFFSALLVVIVLAVFTGLLLGIPTMKVSGIFFSMVTVGFGEIVRIVLLNWQDLTGGGLGIRDIPKPVFFGYSLATTSDFYILALVFTVPCILFSLFLFRSNLGLALKASGSNKTVSEAVGVNTFHMRVVAIILNAVLAGLTGVLYSVYYGMLHPDAFTSAVSFSLVQMLVVGGLHSFPGILMMTPVLSLAFEYLRAFGEYQVIIYAVIVLLCVIFCPIGVGGRVEKFVRDRYIGR
jgi:branched-chain amino acid transport system permease protein